MYQVLGNAQRTSSGKVKYIRVETQGQQDAHNILLYSTHIITRNFADLPELIILALKGHNSKSGQTVCTLLLLSLIRASSNFLHSLNIISSPFCGLLGVEIVFMCNALNGQD